MALYSPGGMNLADTTAPLILAYDDTGTTDVVFAVSSSGDLTITPDGGDATITGTLTLTAGVAFTGALAAGHTGIGSSGAAGDLRLYANGTQYVTVSSVDGKTQFTAGVGIGEAAGSQMLRVLTTLSNTAVVVTSSHASAPNVMQLIMSGAAPDDTTQYFLRMADSAGLQAVIYSDGSYEGSANSYGALSDRRLKMHIEAAESNWDTYKLLKWVDFERIKKPGVVQHGLIAQDVEPLFPDCVYESEGEDGKKWLALNYMGIATETGKAAQENMIRTEALEIWRSDAEIALDDAKARITDLEEAVELLKAA